MAVNLLELNVTELYFSDFGGVADGKTDNMDAANRITAALHSIKGKKIIVFDKGTYKFKPADFGAAFVFKNITDLVLLGQGPEKTHMIVCTPSAGFLDASFCTNISSIGFSFDYEVLPFTQGKIVGVDVEACTYDLQIDEGFGNPTEPWFTEEAPGWIHSYRTSHIMDAEKKIFKYNTSSNIGLGKNVVDLGNRVYRFETSRTGFVAGIGREAWAEGQIQVGDLAVIVMRTGGSHAMFYRSCENTLFDNITVYCAVGFALINMDTRGTAIARNIVVKRKEGRLVSLCSDAINFSACRAKPLVENCYLEANCDDSVSGGGGAPTIMASPHPSKVFITNVAFFTPEKGDRVAVYNQREGKIVGETTIADAYPEKHPDLGDGYTVTFNDPVYGMTVTSNVTTTDILFTPDTISSGITIRNCTMSVKAGRAVFVQSQDVHIENCRFIDVGGQAIFVANEGPSIFNGYVKNVTIKNNYFENTTNMKAIFKIWSTIHVGTLRQYYPDKDDCMYKSAESTVTENISICNNTFKNSSAYVIYLSAVKDANIENNTFENDEDTYTIKNEAIICADNCAGIVISNNRIKDYRKDLKAVVEVKGNTQKDEAGVRLINNQISTSVKELIAYSK